MKFYLAGCFARRGELRVYAHQIRELGHDVVSSWLATPDTVSDAAWYATANENAIVAEAHRDLYDVHAADVLICFTDREGIDHSRGGHHFETGAALGWGKEVWIVGERKHLFHWLDKGEERMHHWPSW